MVLLDAVWWVACVVLVVSGIAKLGGAPATEATLGDLGLPAPAGAGRVIGVAETAVGLVGLLTGARIAAVAGAVLYAAFAAIVVRAHRAGLADCGCLGVRSSAPDPAHAVANGVAAAVCAAVAVAGPRSLGDGLGSVPPVAAGVLAAGIVVAAGVLLAWLDRS